MPDLTGREAKCAYGDTIKPSDPKTLAFFEYMGEGSDNALHMCKHCAYHENAHRFFPYYYPGKCQNCDEDALKWLGVIWECQNCESRFTNSTVSEPWRKPPTINPTIVPHDFEPHGAYEYDRYYCGCHGWD